MIERKDGKKCRRSNYVLVQLQYFLDRAGQNLIISETILLNDSAKNSLRMCKSA